MTTVQYDTVQYVTLLYNKILHSCEAKFRRDNKTAHQAVRIPKHFVTQEAFGVEEKS